MCDQEERLFEFVKRDFEVTREEFLTLLPDAFAKIALTSEITVQEIVRYDEAGCPTMFLAFARGRREKSRNGEGAYCAV